MNCRDFQERILEFRDGEVGDETASAMRTHLEHCAACSADWRGLETEIKAYRDYADTVERDLDVSAAMWPRIKQRIASSTGLAGSHGPARSAWRVFFRQAAFAAALVAVSVAATLFAVRHYDFGGTKPAGMDQGSSFVQTSTRSGNSEKSLEGAMRAIRRAEHEYIDAIGVLTEIVEKRKQSMDPQLALQLERNLKAIDESIEATRKAYYAHPTDPYLALYMLTSYSKKVDLLQEVAS